MVVPPFTIACAPQVRRIASVVPPPFAVQFELTYRCNLRCRMCYNGSGAARGEELTDEEWLALAAEVIDCGVLEVIISGGEPLLRGSDFVYRLIEECSRGGVAIHLITNGSLVDRSFVRRLRGQKIQIVQSSIDGPSAEIHDAIRGPNFSQVVRATSMFVDHGFYCRVGCTIQRANEHCIRELVELAVLLGAHEVLIDQFLPIGRAVGVYDDISTTRTHEQIRTEVSELTARYSHLIVVRQAMQCNDQLRQQAARTTSDAIIVRPNGELRLGCMAPFACGNVQGGFAAAWNAAAANAWKLPAVCAFVEAVTDNRSLMEQYRQLGISSGHESVKL